MYSFSIRQFIWEYIGDFYDSWMFGPNFILMLLMFGGRGGLLIRCQHYIYIESFIESTCIHVYVCTPTSDIVYFSEYLVNIM